MRKRGQHGKKSEKPKDSSESDPASDGSKDADEDKYIVSGSKNDVPPTDDDQDEEEEDAAPAEPQEKKPRDLSNRPDHYKTMSADICVVHDCDLGGKTYIKKKLLKMGTSIYCDETWVWTKVKVNGVYKYVKRYMWVIVNLTTKVCYYLFGRRKRKVIEEFLDGFKGTLMTDAYNAYAYFSKLDGCTHACCWAHVRRIYWSALKDYNDEQAQEFINLIGILYKVELEGILLHRTEEEVLTARRLESIPVLNELDQRAMALLAKIKSKEVTVSSKLEHALNYMHNNWKALIAYIDVGSVLIDNNASERAVRPFTNLRKNFGGFSSEKGGEVAAAWLTFIETCKLQKKAALDFFNGFFKSVTEGRSDYELIAQEVLG